ncbi:MAG: Rho-type gtpase-activating protein [Chrysothrix sp. TS-e1954]|nr:MAG: Rho-type gtpase-activating protein [Chrysothrix sp. TS-e1954]
MESPGLPTETLNEGDEGVYPCKGCGEILEEGKAFELAGNRWHIDCFRCNTCGTVLDSDANLLLLGDGSLICNNCTYSCSACGNKIEDLAILTGDQAFCAACFKCRNCKRKIENLRYARTSQGIFCMSCHESLMARRRKKSKAMARSTSNHSNGSGNLVLDKSLPALPPNAVHSAFSDDADSPSTLNSGTPFNESSQMQSMRPRPTGSIEEETDNLTLPANTYVDGRKSDVSSNGENGDDDGFMIPVQFDPSPAGTPPPRRTPSQDRRLRDTQRSRTNEIFRDGFKDTILGSSSPRASSKERSQSRTRLSPHIAYQEKGRQPSNENVETLRRRKESTTGSASSQSSAVSPMTAGGEKLHMRSLSPTAEASDVMEKEGFKLQEAPKVRRSSGPRGSKNSSKYASPSMALAGQTEGSPTLEKDITAFQGSQSSSTAGTPSGERPMRVGSLKSETAPKQSIPRKEVPRSDGEPATNGSRKPSEQAAPGSQLQHRQDASDIPEQLSPTTFSPPPRSTSRPTPTPTKAFAPPKDVLSEEFTTPRDAPVPPPRHRPNDSVTSIQSEHFEPRELGSPRQPATPSEVAFDEDREIREEDAEHPGLFRKVSKAVRHHRSASDKVPAASPKWHKSPRNASVDISSPVMGSPGLNEDSVSLRNRLRFAQQRITELETEKNALQERVNGTVNIRQVNTELREKRSTMAFLDTQREMLVRELEVMTEHLAKAKDETGPINVEGIQSAALRDLAAALDKVKINYTEQIEDLVQRKNELTEEIGSLIQMKDKGFQEYDSLTTKNTQLVEHNNQLVHNIQELYKQNGRQPSIPTSGLASPANGLGIYEARSREGSSLQSPLDLRSALTLDATGSTNGSQLSGETEVESATMLAAPQVVNIRKGQPKKFNWKKGGQSVAKGVTKGFKGAFGSSQQSQLREEQFAETAGYGNLPQGDAPIIGDKPVTQRMGSDSRPQGWGMAGQRGQASTPTSGMRSAKETIQSSVALDTTLFGAELINRCEYETRTVPAIVLRCIDEVEARGMDIEGIYRKSGSFSQVKQVQAGFEKDCTGYDISDPDLDIHSITSALKQYLRKLPTPLITFDCYDGLLEAGQLEGEARIEGLRNCINRLPKAHKDTLEMLMLHLVRVIEKEKWNLMTPLNVSVVFAPTIMRPDSLEREMSDMEMQRKAVQCILQHQEEVFTEV